MAVRSAMKLLTLAALSVGLGFSQSNDCDTLDKCQEALKTNPRSSLIHFRLGEIYFQQGSVDESGSQNCTPISNPFLHSACYSSYYMNAANEFRISLGGDLVPKWTEVWDHINLGKIFDITQQRDRALNEYRLALRTKDNTRGALDEAKKYTEAPYKPN
jgi:tetratricopeptide (TPR) repeat protein